MKTLQGSISSIRSLLREELDLVGGSTSSECYYNLTDCSVSTPKGNAMVVDDVSTHCTPD